MISLCQGQTEMPITFLEGVPGGACSSLHAARGCLPAVVPAGAKIRRIAAHPHRFPLTSPAIPLPTEHWALE
jgi:hypothetical protein